MLNKKFRLRKRTEFAYSYAHGKQSFGEYTNIVIFTRNDKLLRIGFSVSKKIGKAVVRNKVKRQLRAIVGSFLSEISRGYNLIIIAKSGIEKQEFSTLETSLKKQFLKSGLICKP